MESLIYINTTARTARAAATGEATPSPACTLLAQWQVRFAFFVPGSAPAALSGISLRFALKATPTGSPLVFTSTFTESAGIYTGDIQSVDSSALRTLIGEQPSISAVGEIEWTIDSRRERLHFPVTVHNAYLRPDDTAPDPVAEASLTWLTAQLADRITPDGYFELQNTAGDWFHLALNSGRAPG